ncbi:DUF6543 domain-containing protein [Pseudomonas rubra]|uniref:Uncharacterized protein n=1 Tax=Pseudomonas rubra TaxID=2942627 RepID=A0ABT5P597_9PSED|nr:DUF6543 domain-containing protein [Pseudomonas rubra]MDD1013464.1 hypothetical protein [Pseudomonas rubra]MDD1040417.1 hypothetical protein [Pseudomonas rubra]MDD1155022.1 hypothetical protein [Pseudomonas rubra]
MITDDHTQRLARNINLPCAVAKRFDARPLLFEVAGLVLLEQWSDYQLDAALNPVNLFIISPRTTPASPWIRPLNYLLVERYCHRQTLNLTPGEDFVSYQANADLAWQVDVDLSRLEQLINECGPLLIERYQQTLVDFWCYDDQSGQSPWQWYSAFLQTQLQNAISAGVRTANLSSAQAATAQLLNIYPRSQDRERYNNTLHMKVYALDVDLPALSTMDTDLACAVMIEQADPPFKRSFSLLYTFLGDLVSFDSRQAFLQILGRQWPQRLAQWVPAVTLTPSQGQVFENQARGLLSHQLRLLQAIGAGYRSRQNALELALSLDRVTSMLDMCSAAEQSYRELLAAQLPAWIRDADSAQAIRFSGMLIEVARATRDSKDQSWLDGIEDFQAYAFTQLAARISADHPDSLLAVHDVVVRNYQVLGAAVPGQEAVITDGSVRLVEYSLAQLAIGNLGLLKSGKVELRTGSGVALPPWMDERYLRELVTALDVGTSYPQMLKQKLLDDQAQRQTRGRLFSNQLQAQLPAKVMEMHLRNQGISLPGVDAVARMLQPALNTEQPNWVLRPLGLVREPGADADLVLNTWLIEAEQPRATLCLLYRPLHVDSLLEYPDRLALLVAIATPGALQNDLLCRLPSSVRAIYAHGGFREPHLFFPLDDTFAVPHGTPAPVTLALTPASSDPGLDIYLASANESVQRAQNQSSSNAEARWTRWTELGALLFNSLLPLATGPLAKAAWLLQMELDLAQVLNPDNDNTLTRHASLVNLLASVSVLAFGHEVKRIARFHQPTLPASPNTAQKPAAILLDNPSAQTLLDFSWSRATPVLSTEQQAALAGLRAQTLPVSLGQPIETGQWRGLYLQDDQFWVALDGAVYNTVLDPEVGQMRIVGPSSSELPGPFLARDDLGRWQLDLKLRLRGGAPMPKKIQQLRQANAARRDALLRQLQEEVAYIQAQSQQAKTAIMALNPETTELQLNTLLEQQKAYCTYLDKHLQTLEACNELNVLANYKVVKAEAVFQQKQNAQIMYLILELLHRPLRQQLIAMIEQQSEGGQPSAQPGKLLDKIAPLLDQLVTTSQSLARSHEQLTRLASLSQPRIKQLLETSNRTLPPPYFALRWQRLRIELASNRLILLQQLDMEAYYWLERCWDNLELAMRQHREHTSTAALGEELQVRLLKTSRRLLHTARRQLGNLEQLLTQADAIAATRVISADLDSLSGLVQQALDDLPDYPEQNTLQQLRIHQPSLVERENDGLLLGAAQADSEVATIAQRLQDTTLEAPTSSASTAEKGAIDRQVAALLDRGKRQLKLASSELERLRAGSIGQYLPIEVEEILERRRQGLLEHREAIERTLTRGNQTDLASGDADAAQTSKALDQQAWLLKTSAKALRIRLALEQKPRMSEVQYLLDEGAVTVEKLQSRKVLDRSGRPQDYLDEYVIKHKDKALWYAHFHYPKADSVVTHFTAGHLKTAAQRYSQGQTLQDGKGQSVEVYRSPISLAAAQKCFFKP